MILSPLRVTLTPVPRILSGFSTSCTSMCSNPRRRPAPRQPPPRQSARLYRDLFGGRRVRRCLRRPTINTRANAGFTCFAFAGVYEVWCAARYCGAPLTMAAITNTRFHLKSLIAFILPQRPWRLIMTSAHEENSGENSEICKVTLIGKINNPNNSETNLDPRTIASFGDRRTLGASPR